VKRIPTAFFVSVLAIHWETEVIEAIEVIEATEATEKITQYKPSLVDWLAKTYPKLSSSSRWTDSWQRQKI
jgi:hypothetical protein